MIAILVVALSLATSVAVGVPYLPQADALQARLRDGQPVIVLVVIGASAEGVVVCFAGRADGVNGLPAGTRRLSASGPFAAPYPRT